MKRSFFPFALILLAAGFTGVACGDNEPDSFRSAVGDGDGDGDGDVSCSSSQELCGNFCASTQSDPSNCGECGNACGQGEGCLQGECETFGCGTGQVRCDGLCVNLQTDASFCGACDTACESGQVCENGQCEDTPSCPANFLECGGECIDPSRDIGFCGATTCDENGSNGVVCESGEVCFQGDCLLGCPTGLLPCDDTCVDPMRDPNYCGAASCDGMGAGGAGSEGAVCVIGEVCFEGDCVQNCPEDLLACGGTCIDPETDRDHCGATTCDENGSNGVACQSGAVCFEGACEQNCPEDLLACDDTCIDPMKDRDHCGATTCDESGSNGDACISGELCFEGDCVQNCPQDLLACGGTCINPLTDQDFCGATDCSAPATSGSECGENEACSVGECKAVQFSWTQGVPIDEPGAVTGTNEHAMAADGEGNAIVVWRQFVGAEDAANLRVFARRYNAATRTWSTVSRLDASTETTRNLHVHMNEAGQAAAVWVQGAVNQNSHVFMALFDSNSLSWGAPIQVSQAAGVNETPRVGIDASGNAHVVWSQQVALAGSFRIARNYYSVGSGTFAGEVRITNYTPLNNSFEPLLAINETGDVGVIWWEAATVGSGRVNWIAVFDNDSSTWDSPHMIGQNSANTLYVATGNLGDIGIDDAGHVYVTWSQWTGSQDIWMKKYDGSWGTATIVEAADGTTNSPRFPKIAVLGDGTSVVAYSHGPNANTHALRASRVASNLMSFQDGQVASPVPQDPNVRVALGALGVAHAVWRDGGHIRSSTNAGTWTTPTNLTTTNSPAASAPLISASSSGRAFASWYQGGDLVFARFD